MRHSIATCSLPPSPGAERTGISRTPCTVVDALSTVNGYLPHLRQALYRELLTAELLADKTLKGDEIHVVQEDIDKDGRPEVLVETPNQNLYFSPANGGSLFEWDLREEGVNLQNVLTRR